MNIQEFDLVVIGGGSGGVRAGRVAASHGAKVAIIEEHRYGGTCVIRGCVPKKLFVYASDFAQQFEDASGFGWTSVKPKHDWATLVAAKDREIKRLESVYKRLLHEAEVTTFDGRAVLLDEHTVQVGERILHARIVLIATGATPVKPLVPGSELMITSNEAFDFPAFPQRVAILGGGYIACEFAGIYSGLGADVVQIHRGDQILRGFDEDVRTHLATEMQKSGIALRLSQRAVRVERREGALRITVDSGDHFDVDAVLAATGRRPNTSALGLEKAGVRLAESGAVLVDAYSRTSVNSIFAVGDVTDRVALTPVAIQEGHAFADTMFGNNPRAVLHSNVPSAVFSRPNAASVGLTEAEASSGGRAIDVYRTQFKPMRATLSGRDEQILMKIVVDAKTDRMLGAHMVGDNAGEIIQGLAIAITAGATKAHLSATLGIHPTVAEEFVTLGASIRSSQRIEKNRKTCRCTGLPHAGS
ncbi:glutathione-disulfide reductase [Trinickia mobilis]|uniref:glutathione-disulfide reductase n=1 Tax=Trinickia mobilis TaxID=2816356 RepID=UPI001A8F285E|nr:glutathione-disulfide reductase [Trinickia mobilis]